MQIGLAVIVEIPGNNDLINAFSIFLGYKNYLNFGHAPSAFFISPYRGWYRTY